MAIVLRLGSRSKGNHPSCHIVFFSTSNSNSNSHSNSNSPFSSLFSEIKGNLKESSPSPSNTKRSPNFSDEISKNLHEFRARTPAPPPPQQQISFQKIYQENMNRNPPNSSSLNFNSIRSSLQNIKSAAQTTPTWSHPMPSTTSGSFLGKEVSRDGSPASPSSSLSFLRTYNVEDLGEKLRMLRPEGMRKDWFSVRELSERLGRLRKMEEEEEEKQALSNTQYGFNKTMLDQVRGSLVQLDQNQTEAAKKASRQGLSILSQLNGTPTFSLGPPKPHLVEKYFHPDNMSSSEKLKIELAKVRDDFKMSDSDCGSARVQIAQLTTKIKHLSAVLHKKDVHSRKGLLAMVQRRKRLLKYLRRTDWDSYCFVISKLGLRDNPDHIYRTRSGMAT